uniref:Uncharacterized protein n=1 Tax=Candidozyma auris TaxID=498019 RepID=A0A0L0P2U3_CANAR
MRQTSSAGGERRKKKKKKTSSRRTGAEQRASRKCQRKKKKNKKKSKHTQRICKLKAPHQAKANCPAGSGDSSCCPQVMKLVVIFVVCG